MTENRKVTKKQIFEDWQNAFPQLEKYSQGKYYKILGPTIVGIELIILPGVEEYRPHFVIYSLCGNKSGDDLKSILSAPIVLQEFFNRKKTQFSLPYLKHYSEFHEVVRMVKEQLPFSLEGDVLVEKILSTFDDYSKTPPLGVAPNSYMQASLLEAKLEMAICSGSNKQIQDVFSQIKKRNWDLDHFALWGIKHKEWLKSVESKITSRDKLLLRLDANREESKLQKLQKSELI